MTVYASSGIGQLPTRLDAGDGGVPAGDARRQNGGQHPGDPRHRLQPMAADRPRPSKRRGAGPSPTTSDPVMPESEQQRVAVPPVSDNGPSSVVEADLPAHVRAMLICPRCLAPVLRCVDATIGPAYDCRAGCRLAPIPARALETQIRRALAGTVPLDLANVVLRHIVVDADQPSVIRLAWHQHLPRRPQPSATPRPEEGFLPPRSGRRS